ncbi:uncharacterized protein JCM15063_000739 [Sporobolomyces koalae]|uniref:uncharacterized protein n=1 Tax=Sporobolomyces koalae TaxID=500713 RepID=UPI00317AB44A
MGRNIFSVPIFFVLFRETLEAGVIVATLLSLVEQLAPVDSKDEASLTVQKKLRKRMRWMVWAGSLTGLAITICIGGAFIAVFFTKLQDLWAKSEDLYEGIFCLIASILIFFMSLGMLRMDRSQIKWKAKFAAAFNKDESVTVTEHERRQGRRGKWALFILPMITILREGLEAVTFVGGVSLGQSAKSIPLAAVMGIIVGFICGFIIYSFGTRANMTIFLVVSTNILLLLGAGLFSRSVWFLEAYRFHKGVGSDISESGDGPGSFDVDGSVWHVHGNPENQLAGQGWSIFNAILGWQSSATLGSVLSYCFFWIAFMVALVRMKWAEGRTSVFGYHSKAGKRRLAKKAQQEQDSLRTVAQDDDDDDKLSKVAGSSEEKLDEVVEGLSTRPVFRREDTSAHERDISIREA